MHNYERRWQEQRENFRKEERKKLKKLRAAEMEESYYELCQFCKKDKKNVNEYRDPVTRGLTCTKCEDQYRLEYLTFCVDQILDLEVLQSTNEDIGEFLHGVGEESVYTEHDLYRVGMKEQVSIGSRANDVRYYYCPISQIQLRLIFDEEQTVALRKMTRTNFWKVSANGICLSRTEGVKMTRSDIFRKAYDVVVKCQNNLEKKPTKKDLKGDFWHEKNLAAIAAFNDLGKLAHFRQHYSKNGYRKRKLEPFQGKVDGWKAFKKRKLTDAKKYIREKMAERVPAGWERDLKRFRVTRRHPGRSTFSTQFFKDACEEDEGLKYHGYAKAEKLDLDKFEKDWEYQRKWCDADTEGYKVRGKKGHN